MIAPLDNYIGKIPNFQSFEGRKPNPHPVADQGEIWGPLLPAKFHLDRCNVSPLRGEKPKNRSVRAAVRAVPVDN